MTSAVPEEASEVVAAAVDAVGGAAEQAAEHPVVQWGARLGYVVSGVLHLIMGVLAIRLALGDAGAETDQSGALAALAASPFGWVLLGASFVGLSLLGCWQLMQVLRRRPVGSRGRASAKAVLYGAMAGGVLGFLRGLRGSSAEQARDATALLLSLPFGPALVVLTGLAIIGVGAFHVVKGARHGFTKDLVERPGRRVVASAVVGYVAKGIALAVVGGLFVRAALTHDPSVSTGLDGALATLLGAPAGPALVAAIGAGFACYGAYSFARARYART